jgi:tight adherence protein B
MRFDLDPVYVVSIVAALAAVLAAEALYLLVHNRSDYRSRVNRRLQISGQESDREKVLVQLRRERGLTADGGSVLSVAWFNQLVTQSGITVGRWRAGAYVGGLGAATFIGILVWRHDLIEAGLGSLVGMGLLPLVALKVLRNRRRAAFAARFPDAMDIIVRSLRAGHPVPVAIAAVARELPDPVGTEFGMVADEITYGADIEAALRNMMLRVGQEDLPLFVTSVSIQSTTGGNLSQILDNLSKVIRERFKMRRKIKGLSAEGRAGAMILNAVPFGVFFLVNVMSPEFYGGVWNEDATRYVLGGALFWMTVGNLIMRRMINFKF